MNLKPEDALSIHIKYKRFIKNGILLDTGVLYLLLIGEYDRIKGTNLLNNFNYKSIDFEILRKFLTGLPSKYVITPHILTEFMSTIQKIKPVEKTEIMTIISEYLEKIDEKNVSKNNILNCENLTTFEIGEHSLSLCFPKEFSMIITDERLFHGKMRKNKNVLVCHYTDTLKPAVLTSLE